MESNKEALQFEKLCEHLLHKLDRPGEKPCTLSTYTEFVQGRFVPQDKQKRVLDDLHAEVRARELMGDDAYFETLDVQRKVEAYDIALTRILLEAQEKKRQNVGMTWGEFRRSVSAAVMTAYKEDQKKWEQPQEA